MRYLWAMVLGIALAVPTLAVAEHSDLTRFEKMRQPRTFFTARVHKVIPHFEDAEGRFMGTPHNMLVVDPGDLDGVWMLTPKARLVQVRSGIFGGFAEVFVVYTNSDCTDNFGPDPRNPRIVKETANFSAGGFRPANAVNNSTVYEATGPAALRTVKSFRTASAFAEPVCITTEEPFPVFESFPAIAVEVLVNTPPFTLEPGN